MTLSMGLVAQNTGNLTSMSCFICGKVTMCRIVPVARGVFHIDTEAEGRGCLWGINAVHKGAIQHSAWYIHSKLDDKA